MQHAYSLDDTQSIIEAVAESLEIPVQEAWELFYAMVLANKPMAASVLKAELFAANLIELLADEMGCCKAQATVDRIEDESPAIIDESMESLPYCVDSSHYDDCLVGKANVQAITEDGILELLDELGLVSICSTSIDALPFLTEAPLEKAEEYVRATAIVKGKDADDAYAELVALHELVEGLESYPLYNDEAHTMLEMEAQDQTWEDGADRELAEAILEALGIDDDSDDLADAIVAHEDYGPQHVDGEAWEESGTYLNTEEAVSRLELDRPFVRGTRDGHILNIVEDVIADRARESSSRTVPHSEMIPQELESEINKRAVDPGYFIFTKDRDTMQALFKRERPRMNEHVTDTQRVRFYFADSGCPYLPLVYRIVVENLDLCDKCDEPLHDSEDPDRCDDCLTSLSDVLANYRAWNDPWIQKHEDDPIMLREAYNDHLDVLEKDGTLTPTQVHNASNPY